MRAPRSRLAAAAALAVLAACSRNPAPEAAPPQGGAQPAAAAASPAPTSLAGDWSVTLLVQGTSADGVLRLRQSDDGSYRGFMQLEGENQPSAVRMVRLEGAHFVVTLDTPDGEATIEGNRRGLTRFDALYNSRHSSGRMTGTRQ